MDVASVHRMMVHFPVALLLVGALFDLAGTWLPEKRRYAFREAGLYCLIIGTLACFPSLVSGWITSRVYYAEAATTPLWTGWDKFPPGVKQHFWAAVILTGLFILFLAWRAARRNKLSRPETFAAGLLELAGMVALYYTGHWGNLIMHPQA